MPMKSSCTSRKRATRPLITYSLCPERYSRRPTTTSPGFIDGACFSAARFFLNLLAADGSSTVASVASGSDSVAEGSIAPGSVTSVEYSCVDVTTTNPSSMLVVTSPVTCVVGSTIKGSAFSASASPSATGAGGISTTVTSVSIVTGAAAILRIASTRSGSTSVSVTSDSPIGGRFAVPLKMQSDMASARNIFLLCSPSTQEIASTTFDFPQPFGPTMHVMPVPLNVIGVFSQNDLNPNNSTLRSFNTSPSQLLFPQI